MLSSSRRPAAAKMAVASVIAAMAVTIAFFLPILPTNDPASGAVMIAAI